MRSRRVTQGLAAASSFSVEDRGGLNYGPWPWTLGNTLRRLTPCPIPSPEAHSYTVALSPRRVWPRILTILGENGRIAVYLPPRRTLFLRPSVFGCIRGCTESCPSKRGRELRSCSRIRANVEVRNLCESGINFFIKRNRNVCRFVKKKNIICTK